VLEDLLLRESHQQELAAQVLTLPILYLKTPRRPGCWRRLMELSPCFRLFRLWLSLFTASYFWLADEAFNHQPFPTLLLGKSFVDILTLAMNWL
jgi:hypothetical protein